MGTACSARRGEGKFVQILARKHGRSHLEEQDVGGSIILKWMLEKLDGRAWTGLIWLRINKWPAVVKTLMHLRFPQDAANFLTS
jgi:hypothetical protein